MSNIVRRAARSFATAASPPSTASASASATPYPFSKVAKLLSPPLTPPTDALRQGKGLMAHLAATLPSPQKQHLLNTLFSKRHPQRVLPGSVVSVTLGHAPGQFSGVLISLRRRGMDTSFTLRNVINRTGVEMQFFVGSPHLRDVRVLQSAGGAGGKKGRRMRRAKLFYLRDAPEKMTAISAGVRG